MRRWMITNVSIRVLLSIVLKFESSFQYIRGGYNYNDMKMSNVPESCGQCIQINQNTTIVLLNFPNPAYLHGILNVKAIRGTVRILGYDLSPSMPPIPVYSLKEFNTLKVVPVNDANDENDTSYLESLAIPAEVMDSVLEKALLYSYFFIVSKSEESDCFVSFFRNSNSPLFARTNTDEPMVTLSESDEENPLVESSEWSELADEFLLKCRKIIVCGGKNVGKSTFLRYSINRILRRWPRVLMIDFDPGQSEFTVMGCLSAVLVEKPLLGPNFSHITAPERSIYIADISVNSCPVLYSESIEKLVSFCDSPKYKGIPWVINTMGFVKGLGITLLARIMETIKPTDIVQIISEKDFNNFPGQLTPSFFNLQELKCNEEKPWKPRLHIIYSIAESAPSSGHFREAALKRDIVTMSYLRKALGSAETDLLGIVPKKIKTDDVEIVILKPTSREIEMTMTTMQKLCCINANLVALCIGNNSDQLDCIGFGVVRGFDIETNYIYLITPISQEALERITVIKMSSSLQLPQALYKNHVDRIGGSYPYFSYRISNKLSQPIRKTSSRVRYVQDPKNSSGFHEGIE